MQEEYLCTYKGIKLKIYAMEKPLLQNHVRLLGESMEDFIARAIRETIKRDVREEDQAHLQSAFDEVKRSEVVLSLGTTMIFKVPMLSKNPEDMVRQFIHHAIRETKEHDLNNSKRIDLALASDSMDEETLAEKIGLSAAAFDYKKRRKQFTEAELIAIADILDIGYMNQELYFKHSPGPLPGQPKVILAFEK